MTLRIAFLGCGDVTRKHAKLLNKAKLPVTLHFASREGRRAEQYRAELAGSVAFDSYSAAIKSDQVDVVFIATPPDSHKDLALQALKAGKHAIVEKPPFLNLEEFDATLDAAQQAGRQLLVAENYYYRPIAVQLRALLSQGAIGKPLAVQVNACKLQKAEGWRADPKMVGGGALLEGGIHWVNFMNNLGLNTVAATGYIDQAPTDERTSALAFQYEGGALGTLLYSWATPTPLQGLRMSKIFGSKGSISFESNGLFLLKLGKRPRLKFPGLSDINGYRAMFTDFVDAILNGRSAALTAEQARKDLAIIESVYSLAQ